MLWVLIRSASLGASNEYPQHICFYGELEKVIIKYYERLVVTFQLQGFNFTNSLFQLHEFTISTS